MNSSNSGNHFEIQLLKELNVFYRNFILGFEKPEKKV